MSPTFSALRAIKTTAAAVFSPNILSSELELPL